MTKNMEKTKKWFQFDWRQEAIQAKAVGEFFLDIFVTKGLLQLRSNLSTERRVNNFMQEMKSINDKVKADIEKKIDENYLKSDECQEVFANTVAEATTVRNMNKTKYFRAALINGLTSKDLDRARKLHFITCLSELSEHALSVLATICNNSMRFPEHSSVEALGKAMRLDNYEFVVAGLKELDRFNLVEITWPQAKAFNQSNVAFDLRGLGKQFCKYIAEYEGESLG